MRRVDRADYYHGYGPYQDTPQLIGYHATISAPHMHAFCLVRSNFLLILVYKHT